VNLLLEEKLGTIVSIKDILFATDFSEVSEAALPYVTALSLRYGSTVHLAHVLPEATFVRPSPIDPALFGSIYEQAHSGAQEKMQRLSDRLRGFPHQTYVRHGKVYDVLSEIIREQEIDLLVVGTHGRTGLGKLVIGSVAEGIFRQAPCPVLTVGPRAAAAERVVETRHDHELPPAQIKFQQILYATDFKPDSAQTVSYAISLAREFQARLTLLHVIEDYGDHLHERPGPIDLALRKLEGLVPDEAGLRYRPEMLAEFGVPAELILQTAAENNSDLIILGVRAAASHLAAATHLTGATAHKVVVGASCPVLTVRGEANT
jgi:nucleotide-binding universal stress UspA family protein